MGMPPPNPPPNPPPLRRGGLGERSRCCSRCCCRSPPCRLLFPAAPLLAPASSALPVRVGWTDRTFGVCAHFTGFFRAIPGTANPKADVIGDCTYCGRANGWQCGDDQCDMVGTGFFMRAFFWGVSQKRKKIDA